MEAARVRRREKAKRAHGAGTHWPAFIRNDHGDLMQPFLEAGRGRLAMGYSPGRVCSVYRRGVVLPSAAATMTRIAG